MLVDNQRPAPELLNKHLHCLIPDSIEEKITSIMKKHRLSYSFVVRHALEHSLDKMIDSKSSLFGI